MKNRKTITFDQDILELSKALEPEERKDFFLQLVEHFLEDKQFPDTVSPCLKVALAAASPTIRKLQSKFLNGKCTKVTSCPKNKSELKPTEANPPAHMYNNQSFSNNKVSSSIKFNNNNQPTNVINNNTNLYKNLCTYIIYIKNQPNLNAQQINNPLNYEQRIAEALNKLQNKNQQAFLNFEKAVNNVTSNNIIKFSGINYSHIQVIPFFINLLICPDGVQIVCDLSDELESTVGVRDKTAYFTTMLWNYSKNITWKPDKKRISSTDNFPQRTYTNEELDSFWQNIDDIEI